MKNRAPSTWSGTPWRWAIAATAARYAGGSGWFIEWEWAFSMTTSAVGGSWMSSGFAERRLDLVEVERPVGPVPQLADGRPDDDGVAGRLVDDDMGVGAGDDLLAARDMGHEGDEVGHRPARRRRAPASLPSSSAARSSRALTVGSSPNTSSPTSAAAIARRIASVGVVTVSERRSIGGMGAEYRSGGTGKARPV